MSSFPPLVPQDIQIEGQGVLEAAADLTLSSIGWVAVTAASGQQLVLRLHGPQGAPYDVRTPPLLPHLVRLRGERAAKSRKYKTEALLGGGVKQLQFGKKIKKEKIHLN